MNGLIVLAACVCASTAQVYAPGLAIPAAAPSHQYVDANGLVQTVNYIADDVHGFRVQGTNLPVAGAAGLVAPVFEGVQAPAPVFEGVQVADTEEVIAAKAAFAEAYAAQRAAVAAAPAERKRRSAQVVAAGLPLPYAHGLVAPYAHGLVSPLAAAAPAAIVANIAHATPEVVAPAAVTYAAGAVPVAAAAPSREATLTTIKLNPGHAVFYRVD